MIDDEAGCQNIRRRCVHLRFGEVIEAPRQITIHPFGQFGEEVQVQICIRCSEEPRAFLFYWPKKRQARRPRVQVDPAL